MKRKGGTDSKKNMRSASHFDRIMNINFGRRFYFEFLNLIKSITCSFRVARYRYSLFYRVKKLFEDIKNF